MVNPSSPGLTNWLLLIVLGLIWGASFMAVTVALQATGPLSVAAIRLVIGALALGAVALVMGLRLPRLSDPQGVRIWVHIIAMGIFTNALPFALLSWGQTYVASAFAGVTMAAVPLLVLPLAHAFVPGETMSLPKTLGFSLGFFGVLTLIGWSDILSLGADSALLPKLACIGAAACYAIGSINTRLCPDIHPMTFSAVGLGVAACIAAPLALAFEGTPSIPGGAPLAALIYLGLGPTALATILLVKVIQSAGPSFLSLVNYQVPIWSVVFGVTLLNETLPAQFLTALGIILLGLAITQGRLRRYGRYPSG